MIDRTLNDMSALPQARRSARLQNLPPSPPPPTGLQVPPRPRPSRRSLKGKGKQREGGSGGKAPSHDDVTEADPEFKNFKVFLGFSLKDECNLPVHGPFINSLLTSARQILLQHEDGLRHLATMTFDGLGVNPTPKDVRDRTDEITLYLQSHFPIVRFEAMGSYGVTRHPSTLPNYRHDGRPWLERSIDERKKLTLEISINVSMLNLF